MRSACLVLLISAVAISAEVNFGLYSKLRPATFSSQAKAPAKFSDSEEFVDIVDYLNENASGSDLYDLIVCLNDVLDDIFPEDGSSTHLATDVYYEIPWAKINQFVAMKISENPKFVKVSAMLNDPEFIEVLNKYANSVAVRNFLQSVNANGLTWPSFLTFAFKAVCDTAIVSHERVYTEGVCKVLRGL